MKYWTEDEVRDYLPRLKALLGIVRRATDLAVHSRTNGHGLVPGARPAPTAVSSTTEDREPPPAPLAIDAHTAMAEIEALDIVLRDPARGLVDFPFLHQSGREVLLCWQEGEDDLGWWHLPEDGFAGRRPLPVPPEL